MKYFVYEIFETTAFIYERCEINVEASVQAFFLVLVHLIPNYLIVSSSMIPISLSLTHSVFLLLHYLPTFSEIVGLINKSRFSTCQLDP